MTDQDDLDPDELSPEALGDEGSAPEPAPFAPLALLVDEAKTAYLPPSDHDWSALEQRLMLRLETERAVLRRSRRTQLVVGVVSSLALAAGALFLIRPADPLPGPEPTRMTASVLKGGPRGAVLRSAVTDGENLFEGDAVEVADAPLAFELPSAGPTLSTPRRALWLVDPAGESSGKAVITRASNTTLVLALERGAIEADVTPVDLARSGEAFVVDIKGASATTRVAVHGTHFRVARRGEHLVIDLTEGVLVVGAPGPGLTQGLEVRAPSHVELDVGAAPAAMRVTKEPRAAWSIDSVAAGQLPAPPPMPGPAPSASASPSPGPGPSARELKGASAPASSAPAIPTVVALTEAAASSAIQVDLKRCVAQTAAAGHVKITIDSTLSVEVREDGTVAGTRFTPPLAPAIQECASTAIFARKIEGPRTFTVPVKFEL